MGIYDVICHVIRHVIGQSPQGHVTGYVIFPMIYRAVKSGDDYIWENWDKIYPKTG